MTHTMNTAELKSNLHQLIDSIDNKTVLNKFYDLILSAKNNADGALWSKLSKEEQDELLLADTEANTSSNLIPHAQVEAKHKKWL